ncbi:MAG: adenosylhomocysteine nucleosidase [Acidobacteriaceae bacterium]|jgi:adenosylhomocysteine nucleosidase|nr:adenosylhomocysteine nucleosidase [Acidobacteriaceae bacterium]
MSHRIGIIAALSGELKPLVSDWSPQPDGAFLTQRGDAAFIAIAKGIGITRAEQAVAIAETYGSLNVMVSIGWAGGTSCGVQPGTAYEVGEVIDAGSGERYGTSAVTSSVKLVTLDHVAGREEKRQVAESFGASLVDMEAAAVARLARVRGVPFYCWKAVTDIATEDLPDFNYFLDQEKQLRTRQVAAYALTHPRYVAPLLRMGRNSKSGAEALGQALRRWIGEGRYADSNG